MPDSPFHFFIYYRNFLYRSTFEFHPDRTGSLTFRANRPIRFSVIGSVNSTTNRPSERRLKIIHHPPPPANSAILAKNWRVFICTIFAQVLATFLAGCDGIKFRKVIAFHM